ncbi:MAG: hypothetical protein ABSC94_24015 [Polyangiaceae bacterium]|jgi:hypothetical protein
MLAPLPFVVACGAAVPFHPVARVASYALSSSSILIPRSVDDDALLGRVLLDVPGNGRSLDEVSRPNDCGDKLGEKKEQPLVGTFEDTQELASGGKAGAALRMFGLEADAEAATHFYYKLDLERQVTRAATPEYLACCKDKGTCGYGFVSALAYGQGVYASAVENGVEGSVDLPVTEARGFLKAKILQKRYVYGYVAAFVSIADGVQPKSVSVLGDQAAARVDLTEHDLTGPAKGLFDARKIQVVAKNRAPADFAYAFRDGQGEISENEFVRRYEALTGSTELRGAKRNRNPLWLDYGIAASAVGATLIGIGAYVALATPQSTQAFATAPTPSAVPNCNYSTLVFVSGAGYELQCSSAASPGLGRGLGIAGGAILGSGLVSLVTFGILGYDGSKVDHVLGKADAERYAAKYNRTLLHEASRETITQRQPSESGWLSPTPIRVLPVVSPGFTGLVGQF